jgi:DNA-directed RNA polymerase specialized sigma24 family protein
VSTDEEQKTVARNDVERLFEQMPTQRYAVVLRKLLIEDWEPERLAKAMDITTANLYNIKRRAMVQLTRVALKDIKEYGK